MKEIMNVFWKQNLVGVIYKGDWNVLNDRSESATFLAVWRHSNDEISQEYFFRDRIPDSAIQSWKASGLRVVPVDGSTNKGVKSIARE
jgi:hypothetical protein